MTLVKLEFFPEECCEYCSSTIHTHFNCPSCNTEYAGTDCYGDIFDLDIGETISCESCKSSFSLINKGDFGIDDYEWNVIKK